MTDKLKIEDRLKEVNAELDKTKKSAELSLGKRVATFGVALAAAYLAVVADDLRNPKPPEPIVQTQVATGTEEIKEEAPAVVEPAKPAEVVVEATEKPVEAVPEEKPEVLWPYKEPAPEVKSEEPAPVVVDPPKVEEPKVEEPKVEEPQTMTVTAAPEPKAEPVKEVVKPVVKKNKAVKKKAQAKAVAKKTVKAKAKKKSAVLFGVPYKPLDHWHDSLIKPTED